MTQFAALLGELETLAKAQAVDAEDAKIAAAANDGATPGTDPAAKAADEVAEAGAAAAAGGDAADGAAAAGDGTAAEGEGEGEGEGEDPTLGKSFGVTLADGSQVEAYDGTELVKSLLADMDVRKEETGALHKALEVTLGVLSGMRETVANQAVLIKSLQADVAKLGATGTGRRSVVTVLDKPTGATAAAKPAGIAYPDVMSKALALQSEGKMTGLDVSRLVSHANHGLGIPEDLARHFAG